MRKVILILVMAACCWNMASAQPSVHTDSLYSENLGRTMPFSVLLPSDYDPATTYPVLYLLHGVGSNYQSWLNLSDIENHVDIFPMIVIMPEGELSFYVNAYAEPKDRFEDYLIIDLPKYIEEKYSIDPTNRIIAGYSMGGYGAITLALKHPGLFQYMISICGVIDGARDLEENKTHPNSAALIPVFDRVFGEKPNDFRVAHDPFDLYRKTSPENIPYAFIINGIYDPNLDLMAGQKEFADSLFSYGAYYEYHELPGGHNYDRTGDAALKLVFERMVYFKDKRPRSFANLLERKIADDGIDEALSWYNLDVKTNENSPYYIDVNELNRMGYTLSGQGKGDEAVAVYKLAIGVNPKSANLYDSMSDTYIAKGDTTGAIKAVKTCLKLIPDDPDLPANFAGQLKQIAEDKLKALGNE
ncbi:MAG: prolyl oligopeptidase family serine peptidase [candidate division Zixibacteria bacterium]|nr:prolyl oligopeptidase family serine peptidase [candidate division Zixibacteria bacterium]